VCAGARLLLGLAERMVVEAGGHIAHMDTDSVKVVASEAGGHLACPNGPEHLGDGTPAVRALSWVQVEAIRQRFADLNPFRPGEPIWKVEKDSMAIPIAIYALGPKSYVLLQPVQPAGAGFPTIVDGDAIVGGSEHGLAGIYMDPTGRRPGADKAQGSSGMLAWVEAAWAWAVSTARWTAAGGVGPEPACPSFFDLPAVSVVAISTPGLAETWKPTGTRAFGFALEGFAHWSADEDQPKPVRSFSPQSGDWLGGWVDRASGSPLVTDADSVARARQADREGLSYMYPGVVELRTNGQVALAWSIPSYGSLARAPRAKGSIGRLPPGVLVRPATSARLADLDIGGKETVGTDERAIRTEELDSWVRRCACGCGRALPARRRRFVDDDHEQRYQAQCKPPASPCAWLKCDLGPDGGPAPARAQSPYCCDAHRKRAERAARHGPTSVRCANCRSRYFGALPDRCRTCEAPLTTKRRRRST
jgi:hypothetical protein